MSREVDSRTQQWKTVSCMWISTRLEVVQDMGWYSGVGHVKDGQGPGRILLQLLCRPKTAPTDFPSTSIKRYWACGCGAQDKVCLSQGCWDQQQGEASPGWQGHRRVLVLEGVVPQWVCDLVRGRVQGRAPPGVAPLVAASKPRLFQVTHSCF